MIKVEGLCKSYGELAVLKGVSTEIARGEVVALIGPSGCGKSTFLRCLNLLETPTAGRIEIDGVNITDARADVARVRQKMNMVFQSFNLFQHLPVIDNLTLAPRRLRGESRMEAEEHAMALLRMVGLGEKAHSFPDELSGGQKQRVAIARCLAMRPGIILFDEPTSALDPTMVREVLAVMRRLAREGITMIIVTHEMEFARDVAHRVFYMDEGGIHEEGTPAAVFEAPQRPRTRAFVNRIRSVDFTLHTPDFDLYALNASLEAFCERQILSRAARHNLELTVEELLQLHRARLENAPLTLTVSHAEKLDTLEVVLAQRGPFFDPFADPIGEAELPVTLLRNFAQSIAHDYRDGTNELRLEVRS